MIYHPQRHPPGSALDPLKVTPVEPTDVDQTFDVGRNHYDETGFKVFSGPGNPLDPPRS